MVQDITVYWEKCWKEEKWIENIGKNKEYAKRRLEKVENRSLGWGSDAPIVLGISKYKSSQELWLEKSGRKELDRDQPDSAAFFGTILEPIIKNLFVKKTGLTVRAKNAILQSEEYPFMTANLDGVVTEPDGTHAVLEIKNITEYKKEEIGKYGVLPQHYAQVQHYLCVTGWQKAYVAMLVGGNKFMYKEVLRDQEFINALIEKEKAFIECIISDCPPVPDGSKATGEFLNKEYPNSNNCVMELPFHAEKMVESYIELDKEITALTEKKNEMANQLKDILRENERGTTGKYMVCWPTIKKKNLDTVKVKELLGENYNDYLTTSTYRRFSVA